MSKNVVPCGGFELGDSLEIKDGKLDLVNGSGGGPLDIPTLHITVTSLNTKTMEATFTADKTVNEMVAISGPTWCVVTVPASVSPNGREMVLECSPFKRGFAFGYGLVPGSEADFDYAVKPGDGENWKLVLRNLM